MTASTAPKLREGVAPFYFTGGTTGVLLLHGYSGSPTELRPMGEALAHEGFTVAGPLLAGHGSTPDALFEVTWRDWLVSALAPLAQLRATCNRVIVAGFSMGALLAAVIAARISVDGVILMSPAMQLRGQPLIEYADVAGRIRPWYYPLAKADFTSPAVQAAVRGFVPDIRFDDPAVLETLRREAKVPVGSIYELVRLQRRARRDLRHITAPALVMQGRRDRTLNPAGAEEALRRLGSRDKQLIWFEQSDHQLTREAEKETVWAAAARWIGGMDDKLTS